MPLHRQQLSPDDDRRPTDEPAQQRGSDQEDQRLPHDGAPFANSSGSSQIVVNVKLGLIFRGSIIEKTGGRPKFFMGVFGTSAVSLEGPFTGTFMAFTAPLTIATLNPPAAHSSAFYARDITVNPDNTITHFSSSGPPTPTNS